MLHASTQKLIVKLCELTEAGAIAWSEGERQSSRFETEGYIVEVEGQPPTLRLLDASGRELERADEQDLSQTPWADGAGHFADHVAKMAARAHRIAKGAELAISRILSSLSAPPKKTAEPEPSPASVEFDLTQSARPAGPAPSPHAPPPRAAPANAEADTAIERVLAVQTPTPAVGPAAEAQETPLQTTRAEPEKAKTQAAEPQVGTDVEPDLPPQPILKEDAAPKAAAQPKPGANAPARSGFGATPSFARSGQPDSKITASGLLMRDGASAARRASDPARTEKVLETATSGADVYKPWR